MYFYAFINTHIKNVLIDEDSYVNHMWSISMMIHYITVITKKYYKMDLYSFAKRKKKFQLIYTKR